MKRKRLRGLKRVMSLCLSVYMICLPISAYAQELEPEVVQDRETDTLEIDHIPIEAADVNTTALDISDVYPEMEQMEDISDDYSSNMMDRSFEGETEEITNLPNGTATYAAEGAQENIAPNYAYLVENENIVQGFLTQENEMRWYGFILDQSSKVSIRVQTVSEVDADLYLFELDQETYELNLIGGSATAGLGVNEYYNDILDAGIYYFAVSAYEGSGQYAFAFYATQDTSHETNDSISTAAEVSVNETIIGVIDTPYDFDYYTFTLSSPAIMRVTTSVGDYNYGVMSADGSKIFKISKVDDLYQYDAGTYYFAVYSASGSYDANKTYKVVLNKIANVAGDTSSCYYMVNEKANIVFQTNPAGSNMYVNGNAIDISYNYNQNASNSYGLQNYSITMSNPSDLRAKIYEDQFLFEEIEDPQERYEMAVYYGMQMPDAVNFHSGTKRVGPTGIVLELSLYSESNFYRINCACTGAYAANNYVKYLNFVTVFIDPNTGKLADIEHINYFYEYATGSDNMSFGRPFAGYTKYYYPYYNREEPYTW